MVNSVPPDLPASVLAEVRDRCLQATDVSFVITDAAVPGTPIVWVNEAFTRTTGYSLSEVRGRNPDLLQGPLTDRVDTMRLGEAISAGQPGAATVQNYRRDGRPFWNHVSVSPVRDARGSVTHWVGVQMDVTEQVERDREQVRSIEVERRARTGLALVAQVSDLLVDVDDPYVLREIASLLRPKVVAWAGFFLADEDGVLRPAHSIEAASREPMVRAFRHRGTAPTVPTRTHRTRDVVQDVLDGVTDGPVEVPLDDPSTGSATTWLVEHLRAGLRQLDPAPAAVVLHPVRGRRKAPGLLVTVPHEPRTAALDESVDTVLSLVARRVGLAVENVRLYAREHRLAETLQRAMLPEQADIKDLDVWTYYAPSSGHAQVGGDWYDVLQVSPDVVVAVIGDVVGHDIEAAASMGQLRSVVRAYAYESVEPGEVLDRVDQLVAGMRVPRCASLVLTTLVRTAGGWTLRYSRAGHLPPLVARGSQVIELNDAGGAMIGFGAADRSSGRYDLVPGDVLILYTDGLIERRDRTLRDGLSALVDVTARIGTMDAAGVGENLLSRLGDDPEDDVAVVVVRIPDPSAVPDPTAPSPRRRRWALPSEPGSIGRARRAVVRTCGAWGLSGGAAAELVVSELVANAVLHGWGHVVLRLFDGGEGLRIEVEDANPAPPVATDGHPGRIGGYGMQIVERLADWGWRPAGSGKLVWARMRPVQPGAGLFPRQT